MNRSLTHRSFSLPMTALAAAIGALAFSTASSQAQVLLFDNFDSYANQAAFEAVWPAGGGFATGTLSSSLSLSGPNSIGDAATPATQRNDRNFGETGNPSLSNVIRFSIDFYDSNSGASPYREFCQLIDGAGNTNGQLVSLGLNNNQLSSDSGGNFYMARIFGYTATTVDPTGGPNEASGGTTVASSFFKLNDYGVGLRSTGWHNIAVEITNVDFKFYVDGNLAETVTNSVTARSYDTVRLGSGLTSAVAANFDNVTVELNPTPEPSSILLGVVGAATFLARRRRSVDIR